MIKLSRSSVFLIAVLVLGCFAVSFSEPSPSIYVNGTKSTVTALVYSGTVYLPVQSLASILGITIQYNPKSNIIKVNNNPVSGSALKKNGKIYLPVENIANAAGANVEFDGKNNSLKITTKNTKYVKISKPVNSVSSTQKNTQNNLQDNNINVPSEQVQTIPATEPTANEAFVPRSSSNGTFLVTVTNIEEAKAIKDYYKPKAGYKFVVIYVSQQNISNELQIYSGRFILMDNRKQLYNFVEGLSNFWLVVLRPGGNNFGYLVFEIPEAANPTNLILQTSNSNPLSVSIHNQ